MPEGQTCRGYEVFLVDSTTVCSVMLRFYCFVYNLICSLRYIFYAFPPYPLGNVTYLVCALCVEGINLIIQFFFRVFTFYVLILVSVFPAFLFHVLEVALFSSLMKSLHSY